MIKEEGRKYIARLLKQYKAETGNDATHRGKITKQFEEWREQKEKEE